MGENFWYWCVIQSPCYNLFVKYSHSLFLAFDTQNVLNQNRNIWLKVCIMSSHINDMFTWYHLMNNFLPSHNNLSVQNTWLLFISLSDRKQRQSLSFLVSNWPLVSIFYYWGLNRRPFGLKVNLTSTLPLSRKFYVMNRPPDKKAYLKKKILRVFLNKKYVVGTKKNRLIILSFGSYGHPKLIELFTPHKRLWTPLKCKIFENIMENGTFAPQEQLFYFS